MDAFFSRITVALCLGCIIVGGFWFVASSVDNSVQGETSILEQEEEISIVKLDNAKEKHEHSEEAWARLKAIQLVLDSVLDQAFVAHNAYIPVTDGEKREALARLPLDFEILITDGFYPQDMQLSIDLLKIALIDTDKPIHTETMRTLYKVISNVHKEKDA